MKLEELFLRKEELPILYETCFQIPIHPKLLDKKLRINKNIAKRVFPKVAEKWKKELKKEKFNYDDLIQTDENGLVTGFQISRDHGGNIYFDREDFDCRAFGNVYIKFSKEKIEEFKLENEIFVYASDNIDFYPGALFLRNWAIEYMNEVFKEVF